MKDRCNLATPLRVDAVRYGSLRLVEFCWWTIQRTPGVTIDSNLFAPEGQVVGKHPVYANKPPSLSFLF